MNVNEAFNVAARIVARATGNTKVQIFRNRQGGIGANAITHRHTGAKGLHGVILIGTYTSRDCDLDQLREDMVASRLFA